MGLFNAPRTYPSFYAPYYDTFNFYDLANTPRFFRARFKSFSSVAVSCGSACEHADGGDQRPGC